VSKLSRNDLYRYFKFDFVICLIQGRSNYLFVLSFIFSWI